MQTYASILRRQVDERLAGLDIQDLERPLGGWLQMMRQALGMSSAQLAARMAISRSRANRLERAEEDDSLRISTLRRAAEALNCRLLYVLVPDEPLQDMVLRRAYFKALEEVSESETLASRGTSIESDMDTETEEWLEARTLELVDHRVLWSGNRADNPGLARPDRVADLPSFRRGRRGQGRPQADGVEP